METPISLKTGPGPRIVLVIEDDPDHVLLIRMAASRIDADLDVRVARTGEEALAYLEGTPPFDDRRRHPPPELVILDLLLPGLGGFDILERAEARGGYGAPVVVLSSSVNPTDRRRALQAGAEAFYTKPANVRELEVSVRQILDRWLT